jgi:hypothetical protein
MLGVYSRHTLRLMHCSLVHPANPYGRVWSKPFDACGLMRRNLPQTTRPELPEHGSITSLVYNILTQCVIHNEVSSTPRAGPAADRMRCGFGNVLALR